MTEDTVVSIHIDRAAEGAVSFTGPERLAGPFLEAAAAELGQSRDDEDQNCEPDVVAAIFHDGEEVQEPAVAKAYFEVGDRVQIDTDGGAMGGNFDGCYGTVSDVATSAPFPYGVDIEGGDSRRNFAAGELLAAATEDDGSKEFEFRVDDQVVLNRDGYVWDNGGGFCALEQGEDGYVEDIIDDGKPRVDTGTKTQIVNPDCLTFIGRTKFQTGDRVRASSRPYYSVGGGMQSAPIRHIAGQSGTVKSGPDCDGDYDVTFDDSGLYAVSSESLAPEEALL